FALLLANITNNRLFYAYFACIFFEPVLVLPFVGGTFFRVFYVLILIRFIYDLVKKSKYALDIPTLLLALVFLVTSVLYSVSLSRNISVAVNVIVVLYMVLTLKKQENYAESIGALLTYIAVFAMLSGVYGLTRGYANEARTYVRLYGTIDDSNYSALFYTLGLFASLGATLVQKKWLKIALTVALILLLVSTASVVGLATASLLLLVYLFITQGFKKSVILLLALVAILSIVLFVPIEGDGVFASNQQKLHRFFVFEDPNPEFAYQYPNYSDFEMYLNRITSKRYYLSKTYAIHYFFNTPVNEQLFGGNNPIEGDFRDLVPVRDSVVSHNSYIDMMFMMGAVGLLIALVLIIIKLIRHLIAYARSKDIRMLCMALMVMTVLLFSATISIFPYRYMLAYLLI
ncbi:MAG: hypothetical protein AB1Z19_08785, partial [Eubacteriales bacterium]